MRRPAGLTVPMAARSAGNAVIHNTCWQQRTVVNGFQPATQDCWSAAEAGAKEKQTAPFWQFKSYPGLQFYVGSGGCHLAVTLEVPL